MVIDGVLWGIEFNLRIPACYAALNVRCRTIRAGFQHKVHIGYCEPIEDCADAQADLSIRWALYG